MSEIFKARFKESLRIKLLIGLITVVLIVLMFPKAESLEFEVLEGSVWINDDLIAPFSYPILKAPDVYRAEIQNAKKSVYPVFSKNPLQVVIIIDSFKVYKDYLFESFDKNLTNPVNQIVNPTFLIDNSYNLLLSIYRQQKNKQSNIINLDKLLLKATESLIKVYKVGIIQTPPVENLRDSIAVRIGNIDVIEPVSKYFNINKAKSEVKNNFQSFGYSSEVVNAIVEFAEHFIFPNITYNAKFTNDEILQAQNDVSKYTGIVNESERIIAKHERVTKDVKLKIDSFRSAKGEKYQEQGISFQLFGKFLHIASLITLLTIYFYNFRKRIFYDNVKLMVFGLTIIFISFVTFLINQITVPAPLQFLIFVPAVSMILTIIFGYSIGVFAFGLERFAPINTIMIELAFVSTNAVISPVLTYGLLIFFEKLFNITTDLTLLELSNFDRPLLRDLARKAPGTFNHSMTMGTIAEAAAEKIGANTLLARVGAYYHDIGKLISPQN